MKRLLMVLALMACGLSAQAQIGLVPPVELRNDGSYKIQWPEMRAEGSGAWVDVEGLGLAQWAFSVTYGTQPSAITVALQCSYDGATSGATIGSSTSTTGATATGSGTCRAVRPNISGATGTVSARIVATAVTGISTGTVSVSGTVTVDSELPAGVLYANNIAYPTAPIVNVALLCDDGALLDKCPLSTAGAGVIDSNTGRMTIATDDDVSDAATLFKANLVAHDAADAGAPLKVGGRAVSFGATPTAVAAADRIDFLGHRAGIVFVQPGHPNTVTTECQVQDADGAQTDTACVSVSAGTKIVVTGASISCDGSTTAPTNIAVGFGTANVPSRAHTGAAGIIIAMDGVAAGGGKVKGFNGGIIGVGADDEDVRYTMEDPTGGNCSVEVSYYTIVG